MSETSIRRPHRRFSEDFKLSVLTDYYSSGLSCNSISRKYNLSAGCLLRWLKLHPFSEFSVSLHPKADCSGTQEASEEIVHSLRKRLKEMCTTLVK